jgi:membrane protease subunit HflC
MSSTREISASSSLLTAAGGAGDGARRLALRVIPVLLALWIVLTSVIFVDETEVVIVETLGRIVAVYDQPDSQTGDRGLHFKLPWPIGTIRRFDRRQQLFDPPGREMFTRDRKNVTVSSYVNWKIAEPSAPDAPLVERPAVKFFRGLGSIAVAEARLEARLRSTLSTEFGQVELGELLSVRGSDQGPAGESPLDAIAARALEELRRTDGAASLTDRLGIELVDLRIKRINLPEGNRLAVYERMRTERERIAERYRSAGLAEKTRIESQARRQSDELLARADADAERIKGAGEAEAIRILNQAHAQDPEFYEFQRTLATYSKILNERTTLVLSSGSRLFRLLTEGVPGPESATGTNVPPAAAAREPLVPQDARAGKTGDTTGIPDPDREHKPQNGPSGGLP